MKLEKNKIRTEDIDALRLFFEDVARIPIINGKNDYTPLLRRIRRAVTLHKLTAETHEVTFQKVLQKFSETVNRFNKQCQILNRPLLDLIHLAVEVEPFLDNPQQDMPLALARCLGKPTQLQDDEKIIQLKDLGWRCIYLSSLIPDSIRSLQAPILYSQEVEFLFEQIQVDGKKAENRLIEGTLRYVTTIAYHYIGTGIPYLDLVQEGVLGLHRAAELYDEQKGVHFQIYAATWIRQRITRYIADTSRLIRIPVHAHTKLAEINQKFKNLVEQEYNLPTQIDLFIAAGWVSEYDSNEIYHQKYKMKLLKRVQKYQTIFSYCSKETDDRTSARWPTISEGLKTSEFYFTVKHLQHSYLREKNIPLHLWSKVADLENAYSRLVKKNAMDLSSIQVFHEAGWITQRDVELIKQCEADKDAMALPAEVTERLVKANQQIQYYDIANAIHLSLENTKFRCAHSGDLIHINELLLAEGDLGTNYSNKALRTTIDGVLSDLSPRQQEVIISRFGLRDGCEQTLDQIAQPLGLTRERIRQVETKALNKLQHPRRIVKLRGLLDPDNNYRANLQNIKIFFEEKFQAVEEIQNDEDILIREKEVIRNFIQRYVTGGRRTTWDTRRQSSRAELFREVLEALGKPAHYSEIHDKAIELIPESLQFSKKVTYTTLFYQTDYFRPFGNAIFGLTSWSTYSTEINGKQIFQHCPLPLLPANPYITSFFESIMVGRDLLRRNKLSARQFLVEMTGWAKRTSLTVPEGQSAFDAWYAAGLLNRVDFITNGDSLVELTISNEAKLRDVRNHCLNVLCQRVLKMPELLLTIDRVARPTVTTIQKVLFGGERSGFDLSTRLDILAAFDAIQSDNGEWRLTDLGRAILETNPPQELPDFGEIEAFQESNEPATQIEWDEELGLLEI